MEVRLKRCVLAVQVIRNAKAARVTLWNNETYDATLQGALCRWGRAMMFQQAYREQPREQPVWSAFMDTHCYFPQESSLTRTWRS